MGLWRPQKTFTQLSAFDNGICILILFSTLPEWVHIDSGCFHRLTFHCYSQNSLKFSLCQFPFATSGFGLAFNVSEACHVTAR